MSTPYILNFAADIINETWVRLTWSGNYDYVTIKQSTDKLIYTTISSSNTASYLDVTGLTQNTLYFFVVVPYFSSGTSGNTKRVNVTTPMTLAIGSFYAGVASSSCVPLYWTGVYYSSTIKYKISTLSDDYLDQLSSAVVGSNSCVVYNLQADTSYNFYLIPNDLFDMSDSSVTSMIQVKTDYTPYVGNIYLGSLTSTTVPVFCDGCFDYLHLQYSTDNVTFTTINKSTADNSMNYTHTSLYPLTTYYYRAIPYNSGYNFEGYSTTICGETLAGFYSTSVTSETNTTVTISWSGSYTTIDIYMSDNSGDYFDYYDTVTTASGGYISDSYTFSNLSYNYSYIYILVPYDSAGILGTSSEWIYATTDYTADVSVNVVDTPGIYSIPVELNVDDFDYPYYQYCLAQISPDNSTFYDSSYVYGVAGVEIPYSFTISTYYDNSGNLCDLLPNYTYYIKITPFSGQDTSGSAASTSYSTLGNIISATVSIESSEIYLVWNGYYSSVYLEYCTDNFTGNSTITSLSISRDNIAYSSTTTSLITTDYTLSALSTYQTYYYRFTPISYSGDEGATSNSIYNATATDYWLSDISTSYVTISFSGTYSYICIMSSTDDSSFNTTVASVVTGNTYVMSVSGEMLTYFNIIPYNDASYAGQQTDSIYTPYVTSLSVSAADSSSVVLSWTGTMDYNTVSYSADNKTYTTISRDISAGTYSTTLTTSDISGLSTETQTYYYKIVPYSYGSSDIYSNTGISTLVTYNASISSATFITLSGSSEMYYNLKVYWSGTYAGLYIYYDTTSDITSTSSYKHITAANDGTAYKYTKLSNLDSNTTYYVKIVPYNSDDVSGMNYSIISSSTGSMLDGLDFSYNFDATDSSSVTLTWNDTYYAAIKIYDSDNTLYGTYTKSTNSLQITGLTASTTYSYYGVLYDLNSNTQTTDSIYAYTLPSTDDLDFTYVTTSSQLPSGYSLSSTAVIFTWTNSGYSYITIYNSTTGSTATTISAASGTTTYSSDDYESTSLSANTEYVYTITLTNDNGSTVSFTETVYTLGTISSLSILNTTSYPLGDRQIPITFTGVYNSIVVNISDGCGNYGNITYSGVGNGTNSVTYSKAFNYSNSIVTNFNQTYYFKIYATNDEGDTAPASSTVSVKTLGNIHSFYVSSPSDFGVDASSVPLYWDGSYSTVALEYATDSSFATNYTYSYINSSTSGATTRITNLNANTGYYFRLTPLNQPYSDGVDMSGDTTGSLYQYTQGKITNFYVKSTNATSSTLTLAWEGSFNFVYIRQSTDGTTYTDASMITSYNKKEHTLKQLYSGTTYYFKIAAVNDLSVVSLYYGPKTGTTTTS